MNRHSLRLPADTKSRVTGLSRFGLDFAFYVNVTEPGQSWPTAREVACSVRFLALLDNSLEFKVTIAKYFPLSMTIAAWLVNKILHGEWTLELSTVRVASVFISSAVLYQ